MHNTPEVNLRFKIQFTTTNLRYLLGENPRNKQLIKKMRKIITDDEQKLLTIEQK